MTERRPVFVFSADELASWQPRIREMIPTYGETLNDNPEKARAVMAATAEALKIAD